MPQGQTKAVIQAGQIENENLASSQIVKWKSFILALGILLLFAAIYYWRTRPTQQDVIQRVFGSQQMYDAFATSTNVTAQLLHLRPDFRFNENQNPSKLNGYLIDPPILLTSVQAQQIQHLLQTPSSYLFSRAAKSCLIDYGVLIAFHSGQQTVRVALCFNCDMLGVFIGEDDNLDSESGADFDPVHGQLVIIAKSIFPNDPNIQQLKENRR